MPGTITTPADLIPAPLDLTTVTGNAFGVIGAVARGLRRAGNPPDVIDAFRAEAASGDYDHLLQTAMAYVVDPDEDTR